MIDQEQIDNWASDLETADTILDRVKHGVPSGREIMANEVIPFIRAYAIMRDMAEQSAAFMKQMHDRELQGMDIHRGDK